MDSVAPASLPSADEVAPTIGASFSPDQLERRRLAELTSYARTVGLDDPPHVAVVRYVEPDEATTVMDRCMTDAGFAPEASGSYGAAPGQDRALSLAVYTCRAQYPLAEKYRQPLSLAQVTVIYEYYRDSLTPCLRSRGYVVADGPTFERFLATLGSSAEWSPMPTFASPSEHQSVTQACPDLPPTHKLYP